MNRKKSIRYEKEFETDSPTVLLVDDDDLIRATLNIIFLAAGFQVATFKDARDFLSNIEHYQALDNTCIILDLSMPIISGLELQNIMHSQGINLPIIFYTGTADIRITVRAMNAGAFDVLEKPLSTHILIEKTFDAIKKQHAQQAKRKKMHAAAILLLQLSQRELQITNRLVQGMKSIEAASELHISPRTVETHRAHIFKKLKINSIANLAQLVMLAEMSQNEISPHHFS